MKTILDLDRMRYVGGGIPRFQYFYRKAQLANNPLLKKFYKLFLSYFRKKYLIELSDRNQIGPGLYMGHLCGITINPAAILGKNINIHKGVTIGQENRGSRKGVPIIGDNVWIGVNATIVGNIIVGSDVLIAPNSFVNCDIPNHSVVFGNPCIIKHKENATSGYICRAI